MAVSSAETPATMQKEYPTVRYINLSCSLVYAFCQDKESLGLRTAILRTRACALGPDYQHIG